MIINPNLTLLVQAGNFLIAYYVISKLFLKPWLEVYDKDQRNRALLKHMIAEEQAKLLEKKRHKFIQWQTFQAYFNQQRPDIGTEKVVVRSGQHGISSVEALSSLEKNQMVKTVFDALKKKVLI